MKISVITLHAIKNYGSALQTFATQKMFENYGFDVEIINFIREDNLKQNLLNAWCGSNILKRMVMLPTIKRWEKVFDGFLSKYVNLSDKTYTYEQDFENFVFDSDLYCTGSDQVWNTDWNSGIIKAMFLNFVPSDKYKFSYAASFGKSNLSDDEVRATKDYISEYNFISVREDYAKDMLKKYYQYENVYQVLDPTLGFDGDFWRQHAPKNKIKGDYILIYNLNRSKEFDNYAKALSEKMNVPLVRFCTRYDQFYRPGKSMFIPDIFEFVTMIDNAKYVLTDSFHATAFSLNLGTQPICIYPNEFGGRLQSILTLTESEQCHVKNYDDFDIASKALDKEKVHSILNAERQKLKTYLNMVFDDFKRGTKT